MTWNLDILILETELCGRVWLVGWCYRKLQAVKFANILNEPGNQLWAGQSIEPDWL